MKDNESSRVIAQLSVAYLVDIMGETLRTTPLDPLDVLIAMTVANSNVPPLTRPSRAKGRFARKDTPAPGVQKRGISRNAISRTLNVPLETVRRRVGKLLKEGFLLDRAGGLTLPDAVPMGADDSGRILALNVRLVRQMYRSLRAHGIKLD
jgi:hypothetical protein